MNRSLIRQATVDAITSHAAKVELVISEALESNEILLVDTARIVSECVIKIYPNGDEVLYHLNKPLVLFKKIRFEEKKEGDKITFGMIQEYKKLY